MLTDFLLGAIETMFLSLFGLLPTTEISAAQYLGTVISALDDLNYFLPIAETFALVIGIFAIFPALAGVSFSLWVVAQFRGSSSRG